MSLKQVLAICALSVAAFAQAPPNTPYGIAISPDAAKKVAAAAVAEAKKNNWAQPQCAEAFARCMRTGQWQTGGKHGRTVTNVERK